MNNQETICTCAECFDKGKEVSMIHIQDEIATADPSDYYGVSFVKTCWLECPECGGREDCNLD